MGYSRSTYAADLCSAGRRQALAPPAATSLSSFVSGPASLDRLLPMESARTRPNSSPGAGLQQLLSVSKLFSLQLQVQGSIYAEIHSY
jgi:hypothetical protein